MSDAPTELYATQAIATGGRNGSVLTPDGRLEVDLEMPVELGGSGGPGTNPEQLFAAGWAGCFVSALQTVAGRTADLSAVRLTVSVSVMKSVRGEFDLATVLDLDPIGVEGAADPHELMRKAHVICPYSRATRGNISVVLKVSGVPVDAPEPV